MLTIRQLLDEKIDEIFLAYQNAHHITSGDVEPLDWARLEICKNELAEHIERICDKQPSVINYEDFSPSWYIYTDCDGEVHTETFGQITENQFFAKVSKKICFDDLDGSTVHKIFFRGKEVEYVGWQPCMKFEYKDLDGNTVWSDCFDHWDH